MSFHDLESVGSVHIPYNWTYASAVAREAATGFVPTDVGKFARQLDNNSLWMLTNDDPVTWIAVSAGGSGVVPHKQTHEVGGTDVLGHGLGTGILWGGNLSVNALDNTKFDITQGAGIVVDNYTDPEQPTVTFVEWETQIGVTDPHIGDGTETYISIDSAGDFVFSVNPQGPVERRDSIDIGWTSHPDLATLEDAYTEPVFVLDAIHQMHDFFEFFGVFNASGNIYSAYSASLRIKRSAGVTFDEGANFRNNPKHPHCVETAAEEPVEDIWYFYRDPADPSGWNNDVPATNYIDPEHYDDGTGTLAAVPAGKFTIQVITYYAPWETTDIQYGQVVYDTLAAAEAAVLAAVELNPWNAQWDTLRGWLIVQQGCTDLTNVAQAKFLTASKFGMIQGVAGGTGGVAAHKNTHVSGGSDAFVATDVLEAIAKRLQTTTGPTTLTMGAVADGQVLKRSGTSIVGDSISVVGQNAQNALSDSESSTTSATYQQKLRMTTPSIPAGTYRIGWYAELKGSSISDDVFCRVEIDDATSAMEVNVEPKDNTNYFPIGGFYYVTFGSAAAHNIDMDYRTETVTATTAYIRRSRLEIWRVS